jgi:hypothetical protein
MAIKMNAEQREAMRKLAQQKREAISFLSGSRDYKDAQKAYYHDEASPSALLAFADKLVHIFADAKAKQGDACKLTVNGAIDRVVGDEYSIRCSARAKRDRFGAKPQQRPNDKSDLKNILGFALETGALSVWPHIFTMAGNYSTAKTVCRRVLQYLDAKSNKRRTMPDKKWIAKTAKAERKTTNGRGRGGRGRNKVTTMKRGEWVDHIVTAMEGLLEKFPKVEGKTFITTALKSMRECAAKHHALATDDANASASADAASKLAAKLNKKRKRRTRR